MNNDLKTFVEKQSSWYYFCQYAMSVLIVICCCGPISTILVFDSTALLNEVLIPADAAVGSVIYRLRASDTLFDYPLRFDLWGSSTITVEPLNCTRFNSRVSLLVCQANVILRKKLDIGRFYDFKVSISNQRGQSTVRNCSFQATNATTPFEKIFPGAPSILTVSENAHRNTELGTIRALGNPYRMKAVYMELYGTAQFGMHQRLISDRDAEGSIVLLNRIDYEKQAVHRLTILANDPWTNIDEDTRNIAGWPLLIAVIDEQDTPPIFTIAPPTTTLSSKLQVGDKILRVNAEDGDRGQPRPITYSLDPQDISSSFFHISEETGDLTLALPISHIIARHSPGQPILLKVTAEEVRVKPEEPPSQSTTVQLALIPPGVTLGSPTFAAIEYHTLLDENSPVGTILDIPQAEISTEPGDIVTLELIKNNGTFDITPSVVEGFSKFQISVHNNRLLDYEVRHYVECYIVAKELGKGNYTASAKLVVILNDVNDNPPHFLSSEFKGSVLEHANVGTTVLVVEATDVDREPSSKIRYVGLTGPHSDLFKLDPVNGLITVADSQNLDAESYSEIHLEVKAADENGEGLTAVAKVTIKLQDINDNPPQFERDVHEFILNSDRNNFTTQAFIKALDKDIIAPNNEVRYELLTPNDNLFLNKETGEFIVTKMWQENELVVLKVRAYDGGIPRLSSEAEVRIYPPESKSRKMIFIVPGKYPNKYEVEKTLSTLTGGKVLVDEIRPYKGFEPDATDVTQNNNGEKSVVVATVHYTKDSVVDVNRIQQLLDDQNQQKHITSNQGQTVVENSKIKESSSGDLYWVLILLIVLAILTALILILCCICKPCPLYIPPKKREIRDRDSIVEKLVVKGSGHGRESKSVQVAEWFGRKEAWSIDKEPVMIDAETESIRRHEIARGSDRSGLRRSGIRQQNEIQQQQQILNQQDLSREQYYIREGNTDILRLVTRAGTDFQRNEAGGLSDHVPKQFLLDNGKEILMKRYIDQQQAETARTQAFLPNAVNKLQTEQEFLEASLRQQNALLRQLILDRERDLKLETQSLPAGPYVVTTIGTQTDKNIGTQTEPHHLRPPRRRVQSDWELSDNGSDEEIAAIKERARRRHRLIKNRKIRTPIQEESEPDGIDRYDSRIYLSDKNLSIRPQFKPTRTSELRQRYIDMNSGKTKHSRHKSKSALKREVLKEISASLQRNISDEEQSSDDYKQLSEYFSEDSLENEIEAPSYRRSHSMEPCQKCHSSQSKKDDVTPREPNHEKQFKSETDLTSVKKKNVKNALTKAVDVKTKKPLNRTSRYMEWYDKTKRDPKKTVIKQPNIVKSDNKTEIKIVEPVIQSRLFKETVSSSNKKTDIKKRNIIGPEHPLLQHSEHRYEIQYPKRRFEEDADSGIVLAKPEMAQKKSIFTIAYNDIHTKQLIPNSSVNTP
ncbi:hypothetical protein ABEB36_012334 [Hypothenemus hampei]|uniref:Cadherin domain-containing protein n=1 Tax=Hypothenemus hampei TaxID=57062 RepID=A0ABD1EB14_HYPHA